MYLRAVLTDRPLVYACAGCASAGQMSNYLALKLDRAGLAQMGCLSGVAAGLPHMVAEAAGSRPVLVIDGCHHACARRCLANQSVEADAHVVLTRLGARKQFRRDFSLDEAEALAEQLVDRIEALTQVAEMH
ncbi:zinc-binding protein [Nitrogeniibacter mangrovi]|uniref:Zinc-binding protein n=1 Tax=Nitrogeniibacter mangrovi TaxID=2016596 RepID=A0A6C1B6U9_9RHOO|nr:putative zinc-binding protein [Nitrogeniibacter mangrovi]QID18458.1 zinc-binding protein [Nitrogeniibacter mangrovi]